MQKLGPQKKTGRASKALVLCFVIRNSVVALVLCFVIQNSFVALVLCFVIQNSVVALVLCFVIRNSVVALVIGSFFEICQVVSTSSEHGFGGLYIESHMAARPSLSG